MISFHGIRAFLSKNDYNFAQRYLLLRGNSMDPKKSSNRTQSLKGKKNLSLPDIANPLATSLDKGETLSVSGTNVLRVPFGVRQPRRQRPQRPERWVTLVLPLQPHGEPTPPPQAA